MEKKKLFESDICDKSTVLRADYALFYKANIPLDEFPFPQALWERYCGRKGWSEEVMN